MSFSDKESENKDNNINEIVEENAKKFKELFQKDSTTDKRQINTTSGITSWCFDYSSDSKSDLDIMLNYKASENNKIEERITDANYWYAKTITNGLYENKTNDDIQVIKEYLKYADTLKPKDKSLAQWYKSTAYSVLDYVENGSQGVFLNDDEKETSQAYADSVKEYAVEFLDAYKEDDFRLMSNILIEWKESDDYINDANYWYSNTIMMALRNNFKSAIESFDTAKNCQAKEVEVGKTYEEIGKKIVNIIHEQENENKDQNNITSTNNKMNTPGNTTSLAALFHENKQDIVLEQDYSLDLPLTLSDDNLVLDGNNHSISGGYNTQIMIDANNIIIKNLTFKNFTGCEHGGVISNKGDNIRIENCSFEDNTIKKALSNDSERFGGVIDNGGKLEVINCNFNNNRADSGSCIHTENGLSRIDESSFTNNFANLSGGGALSVFNGEIQVNNSLFEDNESRNYSGAIRISKGDANIHNSKFIKNKAAQHGGAISINDGNVKIEDCLFRENEGLNGGAINQPGGSLKLKNCTFNDNISNYDSVGSVYTGGNLEDSGCQFTGKDAIYGNYEKKEDK